jgi:sortase A
MKPVNEDFSIVIEKIGVNAPIVADVSVTDEKAYREALKKGVAHAISSDYPTTAPSNVYLFAHASLNFWDLGKYATVFNLLRKLELKDKINIFYKGDRYVYEVVNKEVVKGWNTNSITRSVIEPILTLQTCDPPGTTINRFVVTAKLVEKIEKN